MLEDLRTVVRKENEKWQFEEDGTGNGRAATPTADWRNKRGGLGQSQEMEGEQRRWGMTHRELPQELWTNSKPHTEKMTQYRNTTA